MPCYHPIPGWRAKHTNWLTGRRAVVFNPRDGLEKCEIPCGKCIGCRLERSRQWAVRCMHEAKLYDRNCFLTLTYNDANLPANGSLVPERFQLFMKRLRKKYGAGIRFFHCGEYGEELGRPHHHALLFNHDFDDKWFYKGVGGNKLYTSKTLDELWGHGFCSIGAVTFESAGYVARYALKKITGPIAEEHYKGKVPEFLTMSRRPGIGRVHAERFLDDIYPSDTCVVRGVETKPPRYYDKVLEEVAPVVYRYVLNDRRRDAEADPDKRLNKLIIKEVIKKSQIRSISRSYEGNTHDSQDVFYSGYQV